MLFPRYSSAADESIYYTVTWDVCFVISASLMERSATGPQMILFLRNTGANPQKTEGWKIRTEKRQERTRGGKQEWEGRGEDGEPQLAPRHSRTTRSHQNVTNLSANVRQSATAGAHRQSNMSRRASLQSVDGRMPSQLQPRSPLLSLSVLTEAMFRLVSHTQQQQQQHAAGWIITTSRRGNVTKSKGHQNTEAVLAV